MGPEFGECKGYAGYKQPTVEKSEILIFKSLGQLVLCILYNE